MKTINKKVSILFVVVAFTVLLCSCNIMGPPLPEKWGAEYLKSTGVQDETIDKITKSKTLSREEFEKYSRSDDVNVRHLIARNPHIPNDLLSELVKDKNFFVREGVALNTSISREMVDALKKDHLCVVSALVSNPSVPEDVILEIYKSRKMHLSCYARNPKCPEIIRDDILKSRDADAMDWLSITKERELKADSNSKH